VSGSSREHVLKVAAEYWPALVDGSKTFEVRRNDRAYQRGDVLVLYPTHDERGGEMCPPSCSDARCTRKAPTERREVTFVYSGDPRFGGHGGLQPGYVVLALTPSGEESAEAALAQAWDEGYLAAGSDVLGYPYTPPARALRRNPYRDLAERGDS